MLQELCAQQQLGKLLRESLQPEIDLKRTASEISAQQPCKSSPSGWQGHSQSLCHLPGIPECCMKWHLADGIVQGTHILSTGRLHMAASQNLKLHSLGGWIHADLRPWIVLPWFISNLIATKLAILPVGILTTKEDNVKLSLSLLVLSLFTHYWEPLTPKIHFTKVSHPPPVSLLPSFFLALISHDAFYSLYPPSSWNH